MIAVVDYGMGNLKSVSKALEHLGANVHVTRDARTIGKASHLVLPGVGAFPECLKNLTHLDLVEPIKEFIASGKPFLGICLGFQLLFDESDEWGPSPGLGMLPGRVRAFPRYLNRVPHMGWNQIIKRGSPRLFAGIEDGAYFYFVHSFYVEPADATLNATMTDYGLTFSSSIEQKNLFACQFHPEKSQTVGLKVLKNFIEIQP